MDTKTGPIPPLAVTVVAPTTEAGSPIASGEMIVTPDHQPNLIIKVVSPLVAISIRFVNNYIGALVGLLSASALGAITATDFTHLLIKCMGLSLPGACVLLLKDIVTVFNNLEKTHPLLSGSV